MSDGSGRMSRAVSLAICCAGGVYIGLLLARSGSDSNEQPAAVSGGKSARLSAILPGSAGGDPTPLQQLIEQDRRWAEIDPAEFPALLEAELRDALSSESAFHMARVWAERDLDGFEAWVRGRSGKFTLQEAGHGLVLSSILIEMMRKTDPEKAWQVAGSLPGRRDSQRGGLLAGLIEKDPDAALELARAHPEEVSLISPGTGRWARTDPALTLPLVETLFPGPLRATLVSDAAWYYIDNPENLEASQRWFARLEPGLQKTALATATNLGRRKSKDAVEVLLAAWRAAGGLGEAE